MKTDTLNICQAKTFITSAFKGQIYRNLVSNSQLW
jgi:hypothetical protein